MQQEIYFDNSATTRQYDEVTKLMADVAAITFGNPSSLHRKGIEAEKAVKDSREAIAASLGAETKEIYFTSGGTESNNLAIRGYLDANPRKGKHIITSKIEHPSVLEVFRHLEGQGCTVDYIDVDGECMLNLEELKEKLRQDTALISIMAVNNETGSIQHLDEISKIRNNINPLAAFHVDAVQAYGKITIIPSKAGIDLLSISSHKIHGPKGVGALYASKKVKLKPLLFGGGQETLLRSGTENVPGIAGFGLASRLIFARLDQNMETAGALKKDFIKKLNSSDIAHRILSPADSSPYILNIAFENVRSEVLLHHLEQKGIYVSTGSACSSHKNTKSHVLSAMCVPPTLIDGAVRFSFSAFNTMEEVEITVKALKEIIPVIEINRKQKMRRQQ
ncbi:MAG: cysteine desulfurase family protein [Clostridiaceae bacterium]